ncbi:MAG: Maf family protein [Saccharofermentans sp.]|nr:Maf family protein [Saccharofermentans sp.]
MSFRIILASQSPRRRALLREAGLDFDIIVSDEEEKMVSSEPEELSGRLALSKAMNAFNKASIFYKGEDLAVIGSDTVVALDGKILGKPSGPENAFEMIGMLQGRTHKVFTGAAIIRSGPSGIEKRCFTSCTSVSVYGMSDEEIEAYIYGKYPFPEGAVEWQGKAGAYGIQDTFGLHYIKEISGDYYTVVGLPVSRLMHELKDMEII